MPQVAAVPETDAFCTGVLGSRVWRLTTDNRQQATGNRQQATGNRQQATGKACPRPVELMLQTMIGSIRAKHPRGRPDRMDNVGSFHVKRSSHESSEVAQEGCYRTERQTESHLIGRYITVTVFPFHVKHVNPQFFSSSECILHSFVVGFRGNSSCILWLNSAQNLDGCSSSEAGIVTCGPYVLTRIVAMLREPRVDR